MSKRYPGGIITKSPATPTGPYDTGAAPGIWTLDQQMQYQQQGVWPTAGLQPNYIEDVFSTYLYTGTGAAQTITNGIDLSTKGGMVWMKNRTTAYNNAIVDSARGLTNGNILYTNLTSAAQTGYPENTAGISAFNTTGFTLRSDANGVGTNYAPGENLVSWTFRKQPKFFDVVTYTGDGTTGKVINHSLGSEPGCIIVKLTSSAGSDWQVWHRNDGTTAKIGYLNLTSSMGNAAYSASPNLTFLRFAPTATDFTLKASTTADANACNASGQTYVAYLFANDAGGFGLTGTDNVISCGSFTTDGSGNATVTLGYEPQWFLVKRYDTAQDWYMMDVMRGMNVSGTGKALSPNTADAEITFGNPTPTATGFQWVGGQASAPLIYIAIRRGPMKVPTDATKVFNTVFRNATSGLPQWNSGFVTDFSIAMDRDGSGNIDTVDRLRGKKRLLTYDTAAETNGSPNTLWDYMTGYGATTGSSYDRQLAYMFRRAPGYFDVVCWSTTGAAQTINHNLGAVPELMIRKVRNGTWEDWMTYSVTIGATKILYLNQTAAEDTNNGWNNTTPTASVFYANNTLSSYNMVTYLFATCPGVSKVGSYTGNGSTQTINCGFTGGARFVLIKRTDATGSWYVYDTARGMTTLTDPYLLLNSTAAETATLGSVTTVSTGFALNSTILAAINVNAGSYIFLAIA